MNAATKTKPAGEKIDKRPQWAKAADTQDADTSRTDMWWAPPEGIKIAGIDTPVDEADGLYDERNKLPLTERFISSVDQLGIADVINIAVRNNEPFALNGRQRLRAAREANKRRVARGAEPMRVRVLMSTETDAETLFLMARTLNAFRQFDGPLQIARNFKRAAEHYGTTAEKYAASEDLSVATLRGYVALLDKASPLLMEAIDTGKVDPTKAGQIARLPAEEQGAALAELATATVEETRRKVNEKKAAKRGEVARTRFSVVEIRRAFTEVQKGNVPRVPPSVKTFLGVLNGEDLPDEVPDWLSDLIAAARPE